jgi:hypothetical protein
MIYLSFICVRKDQTLEVPRSTHDAIVNRKHQTRLFPAKTREAISALEAISTEQLWDEDTLTIIDEHVKSAIQALFEKKLGERTAGAATSEVAAPETGMAAAQKKRKISASPQAKTKRKKAETRAAEPFVESPDTAAATTMLTRAGRRRRI